MRLNEAWEANENLLEGDITKYFFQHRWTPTSEIELCQDTLRTWQECWSSSVTEKNTFAFYNPSLQQQHRPSLLVDTKANKVVDPTKKKDNVIPSDTFCHNVNKTTGYKEYELMESCEVIIDASINPSIGNPFDYFKVEQDKTVKPAKTTSFDVGDSLSFNYGDGVTNNVTRILG